MTYQSKADLPETLRTTLPDAAQDTYLERYRQAWDEYENLTSTPNIAQDAYAHREGWAAVKREFVQLESTGEWHRKGEAPQDGDEHEDRGLLEKVKSAVGLSGDEEDDDS